MLSHVVPDVVRHANLEGGPSPARLRVRVHGAVRRLDVPDRARVVADDRREAAEALRCALLRAGRPDPGAVREHRKDGRLVEGDQELGVCGEGVDHVRREGGEVVDERAVGPAAVCERPLRERVVEEGEHHAQPAPPHLPHDLHVPLERALVLHVAAPAVLRGVVRHQPAPVDAEPEHLQAELDCEVDLRLRRRPEAQPLLRDWLVFPRLDVAVASKGEPSAVEVVLHVDRCRADAPNKIPVELGEDKWFSGRPPCPHKATRSEKAGANHCHAHL
mmetsp:Transcript_6483/g.20146  ORF Transcript_6483/g.20146 Transcript_6483/m.20146 type:complete len:275 (-) Transcript_6483:128-952(-)